MTKPAAIVGTVAYMSPEEARGVVVDHRTDQFSLGVLLCELLPGEQAFRGSTPADVVTGILRDEPEPLETRVPSVPCRCASSWSGSWPRSRPIVGTARATSRATWPPGRRRGAGRPRPRCGTPRDPTAGAARRDAARWVLGRARRERPPWIGLPRHPEARPADLRARPEGLPPHLPGWRELPLRRGDTGRARHLPPAGRRGEPGEPDEGLPRGLRDARLLARRDDDRLRFLGPGRDLPDGGDGGVAPALDRLRRLPGLVAGREGDRLCHEGAGGGYVPTPAELWIVTVADGARRRPYAGDGTMPTWSPSGRRVAFVQLSKGKELSGRWAISTIASTGGEPRAALELSGTLVPSPDWSREGITCTDSPGGVANVWRVGVDEASGAVLEKPGPVLAAPMTILYPSSTPRRTASGSRRCSSGATAAATSSSRGSRRARPGA